MGSIVSPEVYREALEKFNPTFVAKDNLNCRIDHEISGVDVDVRFDRERFVVALCVNGLDSYMKVLTKDGREVVNTFEPAEGWDSMLAFMVSESLSEKPDLLRCQKCSRPVVHLGDQVWCDRCQMSVPKKCSCSAQMHFKVSNAGQPFWGCPDCKRAVKWDHGEVDYHDPDLSKKIARARAVLATPGLTKREFEASVKLSKLLNDDPERAVDLIIGERTPTGKRTFEAIIGKKRKIDVDAPRTVQDLPTGIRGFGPDDALEKVFTVIKQGPNGGDTIPASDFELHPLPYENLNCVQTLCFPYHRKDCNLVVAAATSAGKTTIAEMFMADAIERGGKAIFLSPLKSVSQEKKDDWHDQAHPWSSLGVCILTGDYQLNDAKRKELDRSSVIVMTSEMLDSKTRRMEVEKNEFLTRTMCLVVDEAHLLTMEGRGDALECGIMRFTQQNPHARVVFLSATMPNVSSLGKWLTRLNGKPSVVVKSEWRPAPLDVHWVPYAHSKAFQAYADNQRRKIQAAIELILDHPDDKFIVFVHSKKDGRLLGQALMGVGERPAFHNAELDRNQRVSMESSFRHGSLRVVIATSTLAYGVNMPARRVIVLGIHRGINEIDPIDVRQEVGRAGRVGLDPRGDAYVLVPGVSRRTEVIPDPDVIRKFNHIGNIESCLDDENVLAFHMIAEIAEGGATTVPKIMEWYSRSFASYCGMELDSDILTSVIIHRLETAGIIKSSKRTIKATKLGEVASLLYFSPFDVSRWCSNFRTLLSFDLLHNDYAVAWAIGNVPTAFQDNFIPRDVSGLEADIVMELRSLGIEESNVSVLTIASYCIFTGLKEVSMSPHTRKMKYEADRMIGAIKMIDKRVIGGIGQGYFTALSMRLQHGCGWGEADLCTIPMVGASRASILAAEGLTSVELVANNREEVIDCLGRKTGVSVWRAARDMMRRR